MILQEQEHLQDARTSIWFDRLFKLFRWSIAGEKSREDKLRNIQFKHNNIKFIISAPFIECSSLFLNQSKSFFLKVPVFSINF